MDLVAYFLRRAFQLLRKGGNLGLIATTTIAQGDTRSGGLRYVCRNGGTIVSAVRRLKWPGQAAVLVAQLHITRGTVAGPYLLDGKTVPMITAFLFHQGVHDDPIKLGENSGFSFEGAKPYGQGFIFDDNDPKTTPVDEMKRLIARDEANREVVHRYVTGDDVNDSPTHESDRYIINFGSRSLEECKRWPDLLRIVETRVKPERESKSPEVAERPWWLFFRPRAELYRALTGKKRALVISRHTEGLAFVFLPSTAVFSEALVVFARDDFAFFACLQSRSHEIWARFFGSSLEDRLRYTPTECFETFPLPPGWPKNPAIAAAGVAYYDFRSSLMLKNREGLTKTYNRFHDPEETSPDIARLRELHATMDETVLAAYGWSDISTDCEFLLEYESEDDESDTTSRKRKKPWRLRWPDAVRDEVLARLLKLNAKRAEEVRLTGVGAESTSATSAKAPAQQTRTRKPKRANPQPTSTRLLPTELRLPESDPQIYAVGLVVALLSEAGGTLPWPRLLDAFVLATQPEQLKAFAPPEHETAAAAWAAVWNENAKPSDLLAALDHLTSANIAIERSLLGFEIALQDGPKKLPPHLGYDAWLALQVAESLAPNASVIPKKQRDALTAKLESIA
jgi:hypothetical protein